MSEEQMFQSFEKEALYTIMAETESLAKVGGWEWDITKDVWTFSDNWLRIHGCSGRQLKTEDLLPIAHPDDQAAIEKAFDKAIHQGENYAIEHRIIRQDSGEHRYIRAFGKPKLDSDGRVVKLLGAALDITEEKKAEEELQQTKMLLESSIQSPRDMIILSLDRQYRYLYFNRAHKEIMGQVYGSDPRIGDCIFDHMDNEEEVEQLKAHYDRALGGESHSATEEYGQGVLRYHYEVFFNPMFDENKKVFGVSAFAHDITKRKEAEQDLQLIKIAVDSTADAIGMSTKNGQHFYQNTAFTALFGYTAEEVRRLSPVALYADKQTGEEVFNAIMSGGSWHGDIEMVAKSGQLLHISLRANAMRNSQGDIIGLIGVHTDISKRKDTEKQLIANERFISAIANTSPVIIYVYDMELGKNVYINSGIERLLGFSPQDIKGMGENVLADLLHPDDFPKVIELHNEILNASDEDILSLEYRMKHSDGAWRYLHSYERVFLRDDDGSVQQKIGVALDITEQKNNQAERDGLHAKLMQAQKMESIGNLAGGIAHEFNNMLAIIIGNNEIIMDELPEDGIIRDSAEEIRVAGMRAKDVVKQLLTFSRQDNAAQKLIDLRGEVQESIKLVRSSTPSNIHMEHNLPEGIYPIIGNGTQINQLVINMCNNAIDAVPHQGGLVKIELSSFLVGEDNKHLHNMEFGKYAKLVVSDNGQGMEKAVLDRIFEPYYTTKEMGKGTGIGLAVVHGIVERQNGKIFAKSKVGEGTTFTVFFPIHESNIDIETTGNINMPAGIEHILFVDDEPALVKLSVRLLSSLGYRVESATNPEQALAMVKSDPDSFDLIITDMAMPQMTGEDLIRNIMKIRRDLPTIICTGYSDKVSEKEAIELGVSAFVMKPIDKAELAKIVRTTLDDAKGQQI